MARRKRRTRKKRTDWFAIVSVCFISLAVLSFFFNFLINNAESFLPLIALLIYCGIGIVLFLGLKKYIKKFIEYKEREIKFRYHNHIEHVLEMDPFEFEEFVGSVFEKLGYKIDMTPKRGDHGIDLRISKIFKRYSVQVKRYAQNNKVTEDMVRNFYGSFIDTHKQGIFITTSDFTSKARAWAKSRPIELVNGNGFAEMLERLR